MYRRGNGRAERWTDWPENMKLLRGQSHHFKLAQLKSHTIITKPVCSTLSPLHPPQSLLSANLMICWFSPPQKTWQLTWGMNKETETAAESLEGRNVMCKDPDMENLETFEALKNRQRGWIITRGLEWSCLLKPRWRTCILFQSVMEVIWCGNMTWFTLQCGWWSSFPENYWKCSVFILCSHCFPSFGS